MNAGRIGTKIQPTPTRVLCAMRDRFPILVHTVLRRADAVLLLRRAHTGYLDGWWALPGGHLQQGEGVRECAQRECAEETGVTVALEALAPLAALPYCGGGQQGVNFLFGCAGFAGEPRLVEPALFDGLRWCRIGALPERTVPYIEVALQMHERGEWFREFAG